MASPQRVSLLPGAENHRHGRVSGDDGLTKIVRTFHARFGSVKMGAAVTARERLAYVHREGKHAKDAADVEAAAGDKEKVIEAADRIRDTARVRRGKTAERLLATQVIELPLESTAEQRQACADAFVADWRERGHQAVAVVHVHGEEHKQPHLHVEIAARPVHADGSVDRSATRLWAGGHPAVEVKKERARAADIVNRTCDPDPPYHPGGFRDIGVERQPRTRIPAGKFREAREEIREARAANDTDEAARIEAKAYAVSDQERGGKRDARVARTAEIIEFKAAGLPARPSQRARLERRADKAEANVATLTDEKREAETQRREAVAAARTEEQATAKEDRKALAAELFIAKIERSAFLTGVHREGGRDLPDLETGEGRDEAWVFARTEMKARRDEVMKQRERADTAEKEGEGLRGEVRQLQALNEKQTKYVTDWHGNRKEELPDLATVEGQSTAWANMRAWEAKALKKARDEARAALTAATTAAKERDEQRLRADTAEDRVATLKAERQEQNRDGRGTGEAGGDDRRPDQGADRPGTEARRGGGAEDHGAGRAERPRAGGDRPEGDDGREQTGGVGQPASAGGPHAVDGNVGGDRGAAPARGREGVESRVVAAPDREDAGGLAREHGPVEEPGVVETHANRRGGDDGADVGGDRGDDWNWLLEVGDANPLRRLAGQPDLAAPPSDVVASRPGGDAGPVTPPEAAKPEKTEPPARPWKDLSDDELVNHWGGASRRRRAATTDENKDDARRKIEELHAEAGHRKTTLKTLAARKQQREGRGGGMEM